MIDKSLPEISIVIPVFNQHRELMECLQALQRQTCQPDRYEVVVVDNGSEPPIGDVSEHFTFARCVVERTPGSYAARNRGIAESRAAILGFTDADCLPSPSWIESGIRAVKALPGTGMIAGKIALTFQNPDSLTAAELFEAVFGFPQKTYISWGFGTTANLFTTRKTFDEAGLFDARLLSSGDKEWGQRVRARGLTQLYADDVVVTHTARCTLRDLFRKSIRIAGGIQQMADQQGEGTKGVLYRARVQLIQLERVRTNLSHPSLNTWSRKAKFASVVWMVELLQAAERYRVRFGGKNRRT